MKVHLKNIEGVMPIVRQLRVLCGEHIKVDALNYFIEVDINTNYESRLGWIFSEASYDDGNYRICVFNRDNHDNEVNIPLKFIDCLFDL